jgi:3-phenylpropionate/trans-cinnamate dioxygenase ferredoxin reductase component
MTARKVVIVGAGLAGARAAETLRADGHDGRIVLVGEEPVAPYERPALSKEFLAGIRDEESLLLRKAGFWGEHGIELVLGTSAVGIDPVRRVVETNCGRDLTYDALVLATGSRPRRLPFSPCAAVHELRTIAEARRLRDRLVAGAHLVVVGGGFVGAEVASTSRSLGVRVTVVEAGDAPLERVLGVEVGLLLAARWRRAGVDVRLRTTVARIDGDRHARRVMLSDGGELRADLVLVAVGVTPASELIPQPLPPNVFVAGDVGGTGHWTAAALDGAAAAKRVLGLPVPARQAPYVWSDQFGLRLQVVGSPCPELVGELEGAEDSFAVRYEDDQGRLRGALLANRPAQAAAMRRSLVELQQAA